ncbi:MAG: HIT family protein [Gammaproteobacteria bacterium]
MAEECIFCKIVAGEIPCFKLYEDGETLAFMDINPANEGHALVIPKSHAPNLFEVSPEALSATARAAQRVARAVQATLDPPGMNLLQCNGAAAAQSVQHFHMHVLPRQTGDDLKMNWGIKPGDPDAIGALAERIRANIG